MQSVRWCQVLSRISVLSPHASHWLYRYIQLDHRGNALAHICLCAYISLARVLCYLIKVAVKRFVARSCFRYRCLSSRSTSGLLSPTGGQLACRQRGQVFGARALQLGQTYSVVSIRCGSRIISQWHWQHSAAVGNSIMHLTTAHLQLLCSQHIGNREEWGFKSELVDMGLPPLTFKAITVHTVILQATQTVVYTDGSKCTKCTDFNVRFRKFLGHPLPFWVEAADPTSVHILKLLSLSVAY